MEDQDRRLIAWAVQEIRDMDELCRSAVPGYDSLGSAEMQMLARLKEMAAGATPEAFPDQEALLQKIEEALHKCVSAIARLDFATVKREIHDILNPVVHRKRR